MCVSGSPSLSAHKKSGLSKSAQEKSAPRSVVQCPRCVAQCVRCVVLLPRCIVKCL